MAVEKIHESLLWARNAGADLSGDLHKLAHVDTDGDIVLAGAGEKCLGTIYEAAAENNPVTVQFGGVAKVIVGTGGITAGQLVAAESGGLAVAATTGDQVVGVALVSGGDGDVISVALGGTTVHA